MLRMVLAAAVMAAVAILGRERSPPRRRFALHLLAGALLNGVYLCTSWWAVARGMPSGIMALLGALQPLLVAVGSFLFLGERLPGRGWAGLAVGLAGVVLVIAPLLGRSLGAPVPAYVVAAAGGSILSMAAGTLIQRSSLAQDSIYMSSAIQNAGGALVATGATALVGDFRWDNSPVLWLALSWSVLGLSISGVSLLVWMVRHQGPTRVSVLLLLAPPLAALEARLLFGEHLSIVQLVGFALALGGVLLARARSKRLAD